MTLHLAQNAPRARAVLNELDPEGPSQMNGIKHLGGNA
jgi:hypothetical protein